MVDLTTRRRVINGQTVSGYDIKQGGLLDVDGTAISSIIETGGQQYIEIDGVSNNATISGGREDVEGIDNFAVINSGKQNVHSGGTSISDTISGGSQDVYDGASAKNTIISSGNQIIESGGNSFNSTISGGTQDVYGIDDAIDIQGGRQNVRENGNSTNATIEGGVQDIRSNGIVSVSLLKSGTQEIEFGGSVTGDTVSGGIQDVYGNEYLGDVLGGRQNVRSGGTVSGDTVDGGLQDVYSGASADGSTITSGQQFIESGGTSSNTVIKSGGLKDVASTGSTGNDTIDGGVLHLFAGSITTGSTKFMGSGGKIVYDGTGSLTSPISGFDSSDFLDLTAIDAMGAEAVYDVSTSTLTVMNGAVSDSFSINPPPKADIRYAVSNDGNGHALVALEALPTYTIAESPASGLEGTLPSAGTPFTYTVTRTGDVSQSGTVDLTLSGTATPPGSAGADYGVESGTGTYTSTGSGSTGMLTFAAGNATSTFVITSTPDSTDEPDETVTATLTGVASGGGQIGSTATATATITNDDVAPPMLPGGGGGGGGAGAGIGGAGGNASGTSGGGGGSGTTPIPVIAPPANNTPTPVAAPVVAFDPSVSVLGAATTLTGTVSAAAGVSSLELYEGTADDPNRVDLGSASVNADGTWSFNYDNGPGFHTNLQAVATDPLGQQTTALSYYDLTTGVVGEPYRTIQDSYDPTTYAYEGSTFFKRSGDVYLQSSYSETADGGPVYDYTGGSFFHGKAYSSFVDTYDPDGTLIEHVENNRDGSHSIEVDGVHQFIQGLGADTFAANGTSTRFVIDHGVGRELITGFQVAGAGHDIVSLPNSDAGRLANILAHATGDGQGDTTIKIGQGDTITFAGVSVAQLQKHAGDFVFHA